MKDRLKLNSKVYLTCLTLGGSFIIFSGSSGFGQPSSDPESESTPIPPSTEEVLCPTPDENTPGLVSLNYKDANLSTVLRSLAVTHQLNLVTTSDIQGKVTVSLHDVPVEEALRAILSVNGYTFTKKDSLIYITPGLGSEKINLVTETIALSYLPALEAERIISRWISANGTIEINKAVNSLIISDYPESIAHIKNALKGIDTPPIQVLIEAKIVDIESKAFENLGITYTLDYDEDSQFKGIFDRSVSAAEEISETTTLAGPSSQLSGGQLTITAITKSFSPTITIDALIQNNKAHLLASPSIMTLNGEEARIIIGEKYPFTEKTQTTTGTTETTKFVDVGTTLRVTPFISPDGWITMNVHPEVSSVSQALDAGPRITTREADAKVRVRDGQTIIIGGLISKQDDQIKGGIPILRKIPLLGFLFSNRSSDLQEKELTVFITPKIVKDKGQEELTRPKDIRLQVDRVGSLNIVAKMIDHALNLERNDSAESANKTLEHRKQEMLNTYRLIWSQYPDAQQMDLVLYKLGRLYYDYLRAYQESYKAFEQLTADYPDSRYRKKAQKYIRKLNKKLNNSSPQK